MSYVVTAPLVGVNGADGKLKYLFQGAVVPLDVSDEDLARLADGGLIESTEPAAPVKAAAKKSASDGTA